MVSAGIGVMADGVIAELGPLVLIIEDEPTQRTLLTRVLEREGYRGTRPGRR